MTANAVDTLEQLSDEHIVHKILQGEIELFEVLMRRHNRRLFRAARSILLNDWEAEDIVQDAYVRAYTHLASFEGRAKFSTWLTRIAVYEALARKRRDSRMDEVEVEVLAAGDPHNLSARTDRNPEQQVMDEELRASIEKAIDQLPLHYRTVFVLRDVQGLDTAETAECLGLGEQAVKTRLHRARNILKDVLTVQAGTTVESAFNFLGERCDRIVARVMARISAHRGQCGRPR